MTGKTIKSIRKQKVGTYGYTAYLITFTDGSAVRFYGDSGANVNIQKVREPKREKNK